MDFSRVTIAGSEKISQDIKSESQSLVVDVIPNARKEEERACRWLFLSVVIFLYILMVYNQEFENCKYQ